MGETASKSESRESLKQYISAEEHDVQEEENGDIDVLKPTHAVSIIYKSQKQKKRQKSQSHQPISPATTKKSPTSTKSNPCQSNLTPTTKSTPPCPSSFPQIILEQVEREEDQGFEELARHESNPEQANASRILKKVCGQCQFVVECSRAGPLLVPYICYDKYAMRD